MATRGRELLLREQLANPHEDQVSIFRSDELHAAEPHLSVTARVIREEDLVSRQRYPETLLREYYERPRWTVSDNPKRRDPLALPEDRRWRREVDEQRDVVHLALESKRVRSVAGYRRIDEQGPCVDAASKIVKIGEAMPPEVLSGVLAAYAMVALEHDGRIQITQHQRVEVCLVEQARAVDSRDRALLFGADVDQLDRRAALEQCLQVGGRQLTNRRRLLCRSVVAH